MYWDYDFWAEAVADAQKHGMPIVLPRREKTRLAEAYRVSLRAAAVLIAANRNEEPAGAWKAFRKLFLQERRDWKRPGAPRVGWKRGELAEVVLALLGRGDFEEEWGDVGYYVAQTWWGLWRLYVAVTPIAWIRAAVVKFTRRAEEV